jgi:hypothetical protein
VKSEVRKVEVRSQFEVRFKSACKSEKSLQKDRWEYSPIVKSF